jgi:hypothetical protein
LKAWALIRETFGALSGSLGGVSDGSFGSFGGFRFFREVFFEYFRGLARGVSIGGGFSDSSGASSSGPGVSGRFSVSASCAVIGVSGGFKGFGASVVSVVSVVSEGVVCREFREFNASVTFVCDGVDSGGARSLGNSMSFRGDGVVREFGVSESSGGCSVGIESVVDSVGFKDSVVVAGVRGAIGSVSLRSSVAVVGVGVWFASVSTFSFSICRGEVGSFGL